MARHKPNPQLCPYTAPLEKPGPMASERASSPPGKGRLRVGKGYSRAASQGYK